MKLHELLQLERSLLIFDTETTGPDPSVDRIVELGFMHIKPAEGIVKEWQTYVNPGMPIPHEASHGNGANYSGHGITDEMVADAPSFKDLAPHLLKGFHDVDYGGYNIRSFDLPLMAAEFARCGQNWTYSSARVIDGYRLWQVGESRTLGDAVERFCRRRHEGAHRALDDVKASHDVIVEQLILWTDLPRNMSDLHTKAYPIHPDALDPDGKIIWKDGAAVINFGKKYKGKTLQNITPRDLRWLAKEAMGLNDVVKQICLDASMGTYPKQPQLKGL